MIKFVIFDVDGTLIDSVDLHAEAWRRTFLKFGKNIDFTEVRQQIGKGSDQLLPVFFSEQELADFGKEMEDYRSKLFKTEYLPQIKPFPQVRALFERLNADGKKIALGSSAAEEELQHFIELLEIKDLIVADTNSDEAENSKPQPDIFQVAMKKLGNPQPAEIRVVGDTPYDVIAARKAGIETIGVLCGGFPSAQFEQEGCREIYQNPADLLAKYESSSFAAAKSAPAIH